MPQKSVVDMLVFYIKTARARAIVHTDNSIFYNNLNRTFSLPAIIITGIAGPLELIISTSSYLSPVILITTCVLLSIQGVYKFAVKGEQHENSSRELYSLALNIETELALETTNLAKLLKEVTKRFNEIVKQSPTIKDAAVKHALCSVIVNINLNSSMANAPASDAANDTEVDVDELPAENLNAAPLLVAFEQKKNRSSRLRDKP